LKIQRLAVFPVLHGPNPDARVSIKNRDLIPPGGAREVPCHPNAHGLRHPITD